MAEDGRAGGSGRRPEVGSLRASVQDTSFVITSFTANQHLAVGQPPDCPPAPPLTHSLILIASRSFFDTFFGMQLDNLDVSNESIIGMRLLCCCRMKRRPPRRLPAPWHWTSLAAIRPMFQAIPRRFATSFVQGHVKKRARR